MIPLQVTATLRGQVALPRGTVALDSLLAAAVAMRDNLPPAFSALDLIPIEIPIAREPGGRFHLASFGECHDEQHEAAWINRRYPVDMAQAMGDAKLRRIQISTGPCKSYRIPLDVMHLQRDEIRWWCVGLADEIRALLASIHYIGKKRSVGYGAVDRWDVVERETWEGFPVVRDGQALRPLPLDWPGLREPQTAFHPLSFPYDKRNTERPLCAVP